MEEHQINIIKKEFDQDMGIIKNQLTTLGFRVELVYNSLVGNEIAKDGGLVKDIHNLQEDIKNIKEKDIPNINEKIEVLEMSGNKKSIYVNLIYAAVACIITIIVHHFIK